MPKSNKQMIEAAREVYVKHRGRNMKAIVQEMRDRGWKGFTTSLLRGRCDREGTRGWILHHGFINDLEPEDRDSLLHYRQQKSFRDWLPTADERLKWHWPHQQTVK